VSKRAYHNPTGRYDSEYAQREQALCKAAVESHKYDSLSDEEWVRLCETAARKAMESPMSAA